MRKLLLVVFIGMVLAMNIYGLVQDFMVEKIDRVDETTITVYME